MEDIRARNASGAELWRGGRIRLAGMPLRDAAKMGVALALLLSPTHAKAQQPSLAEELTAEAGPRTDASAIGVAVQGDKRWVGPLAPYAADLAAAGIRFDANAYNYFYSNPSLGLRPGQLSNSAYYLLSMDLDLARIAGIDGAAFHFTQTFFGLRWNNRNMISDIGDSTIGYQSTFNRDFARLSIMTYEQKLLDDRLTLEVGRTHPNRYYALPPCQSSTSCFQDILQINGGLTSPLYSVWGGNALYKLTPESYIQAGSFSVTSGANFLSGYDWGYEPLLGATTLAEIGRATTFATDAYPGRIALTGFYNSADHEDNYRTVFGTSKGLNPGVPVVQRRGTSGVIVTGSQVIWRADGGRFTDNLNPTSIQAYGSFAFAPDTTIPIQLNGYAGLTLQAPDQTRPFDRYSIKFNWQQIAPDYARFLADANFSAGGTGQRFSQNKFIFEFNAHLAITKEIFFEPVVQYAVNPNSYWNPFTARRPKDGFYVGGALIVPVGILLGLAPG